MHKFITLNALNDTQKNQYKDAINKAFPTIISQSPVILNNWSKLEAYFPEYQFFLISDNDDVIGFMNTVPFQFDQPHNQLPDRGWDWMFRKGINGYEYSVKANHLGGLQVIVRSSFQSLGFSKVILDHAKSILSTSNFKNLIIPIRPTKKHNFPTMTMSEYLNFKDNDKIYDPWIRTHLKSGAQIIKICENSMIMIGNIKFWEKMLNKKIHKSGSYTLSGALQLINIDIENDRGEYIEPNIWIKY